MTTSPVPGVPMGIAWIVALAVLLSISRLHQYISILATLQTPLLLSVTGLIGLVGSMKRWRPEDLKHHWLPRGIFWLSVIAVVGAPLALNAGRAVMYLYDAYVRAVLLSVMVWAVARTPRGMSLMVKTVVCAGVTTALLALVAGQADNTGRLASAYTYDPNDLALICVVTIPLLLWWMIDRSNPAGFFAILGLPPLLLVFIDTGSRGGFLALAMVIVGMFVLSSQGKMPAILRRISIGTVTLGVLAVPLLPGDYMERMQSILTDQDDYNLTSRTGRKAVWTRGMGYAFTHPLLGVGIDNFSTAEGRISDVAQNLEVGEGFKWSVAHNSFVQALAELGLIGGTLFAILVLRTTMHLLRYVPPHPSLAGGHSVLLPPLLGVTFLAFATGAFFLSFQYSDLLFVLFGLACAVFTNRPGDPRQLWRPPASQSSTSMPAGPRRPSGPVPGSRRR